jgi:hypothetical protein
MIEWNAAKPLSEYEVRVGHMRVIVRGGSFDDAISQARRELSRDMPRMWDVIHTLATNRFQVTRVDM